MVLFSIRRCLVLILGGSSDSDQFLVLVGVSRPFLKMTSLCFRFFPIILYAIVMHDVNYVSV